MLAWLLMAAPDATLVERASSVLSAKWRCPGEETTDVTVCGLRRADRYRIPFVVHDAGDPRWEGVADERARWLKRPSPIEALSPFRSVAAWRGCTQRSAQALSTSRPCARWPRDCFVIVR